MRISDIVAQQILELMQRSHDGVAEIQRNELADRVGCVPSQINYVLTSRFTPEQGFIVESRRGGGGYIRISRVKVDRSSALMHLVNSIGETLDANTARAIIQNISHQQMVSHEAARLIMTALSDKSFQPVPPALRDRLRAAILKQMLLAIIQ